MSTNDGARFDAIIDRLHASMNERVDRIQTYFRNERPPGKEPQPEEVQLQQYLQVRDSPEAWTALIQQRGMKNSIKYNEFGERLLAKWQKKALKSMGMPAEAEPRKVNNALVTAIMGQFSQMQQQALMGAQGQQPATPPAGDPNAVQPGSGAMASSGGQVLPPGAGGQGPMDYPA
jgi:hypothetical protein